MDKLFMVEKLWERLGKSVCNKSVLKCGKRKGNKKYVEKWGSFKSFTQVLHVVIHRRLFPVKMRFS